ncbi:MAG: hypothetical protein DMG76_17480 [Acidobacteria bacterium]|nr:MAG: hypothetical protein DMG76_17480 [Acidobacteriota bacterium]
MLAARQGSQDCIKHTIKILRNRFSKKSQHNPGSTLVSSAPNLWAVDLWKVYFLGRNASCGLPDPGAVPVARVSARVKKPF